MTIGFPTVKGESKTNSFFSFSGTIDRLPFLGIGLALMALKVVVDFVVALVVFDRPWSVSHYLAPVQVTLLGTADAASTSFFVTMMVLALPFVWVGLALTVRRLRSIGIPIWWAFLFFVPMVNYLCFALLCLMTPRVPRPVPTSSPIVGPSTSRAVFEVKVSNRDAAIAILATSALGLLLTGFNIFVLGVYGAGLFLGLPFSLGLIAAVLGGHRHARTAGACMGTAVCAIIVLASLLIVLALEGAVCIFMAAPLWLGCAALGGWVGYLVQLQARDRKELAIVVIGLVLSVPVLMGAEAGLLPKAPLFRTTSSVVVNAPRSAVWPRVIAFPDLPPATSWVFSLGVARPLGATIEGAGPGAIRKCRFSTGCFTEPIEIWDEPSRLHFSVSNSPPPMTEWSIYENVQPPHVHGFLNSRAGEFVLEDLPGNRTKLMGTTWYEHNLWPAAYWRWWSDYLIHRIHIEVLDHVRSLAERDDFP